MPDQHTQYLQVFIFTTLIECALASVTIPVRICCCFLDFFRNSLERMIFYPLQGYHKLASRLRKNWYILLTILKSQNKAAYYVLWLKFLQYLFNPLDRLFALVEKVVFKSSRTPIYPVIIVTGFQRTGATFVAQALEQVLPYHSISNFETIFPRSAYFVHSMIKPLRKNKIQKRLSNFYGVSTGIFSMGDCHDFWDKWFGDDHYTLPESVSDVMKQKILHQFSLLQSVYKTPTIFKMSRGLSHVSLMKRIFDRAFFVVVRRDPVYSIQSSILANKDFYGNPAFLWGLRPKNEILASKADNYVEASCRQYVAVNADMNEELSKIGSDSVIEVDYDDFCLHPFESITRIFEAAAARLSLKSESLDIKLKPFNPSRSVKDQEIYLGIIKCLENLGQ